MQYLNIDIIPYEPFKDKFSRNDIECEKFVFSDGTYHIKINPNFDKDKEVTITTRGRSFMAIAIATDALWRLGVKSINLFMPYLRGSRQDRVMVEGEPLTAKVFATLINSLGFNRVITFDLHSGVSNALINNSQMVNNHHLVKHCLSKIYPTFFHHDSEREINIVSVDSGSNKKITDVVKFICKNSSSNNKINLVKCDKTRDVASGDITAFEVYSEDLKGVDCILIDDCCSNGGTFLGLADKLIEKNCGNLYLIFSHFDGGSDPIATLQRLKIKFKHIFFTDSLFDYHEVEQVTQVKASENQYIFQNHI